MLNIIEAIRDKNIFKDFFGPTWETWIVFLCALFALPMTPEQLAIYQKHTGRSAPPAAVAREAWLVIGRRGGKSFILAVIAVFLACFRDWRKYLAVGECGTIMIIAADRRQARVIYRYCLGLLKAVPMLRQQIKGVTQESISLKNNIVIEIHTASFRSTRGYTICCALLDELAFWPTDETASEPDSEVLSAVKPGMATIPEAVLLCASSPYGRKGTLWDAYRKHYAQDGGPVLVWQASTRAMNATVPQSFIDQHMEEDEPRARSEYLAEFRTDIEGFVSREAVMACVSPAVFERPREHYKVYSAFCDPSGGSSDSFTLAIGHKDLATKVMVIDAIREARAPFNPTEVVQEFTQPLKSYGVSKIVGDRYAGEWPKEAFGKHGIRYEQSAKPKSDMYCDLLAAINSKRVALLDNGRLISQLCGLERRTARSGKDLIDHPAGAHDDVANAVAGLCSGAINKYPGYDPTFRAWQPGFVDEDTPPSPQPQPEPVLCNGNWWKSMPRSQPTYSANDRLRSLYNAIDMASKSGFLK